MQGGRQSRTRAEGRLRVMEIIEWSIRWANRGRRKWQGMEREDKWGEIMNRTPAVSTAGISKSLKPFPFICCSLVLLLLTSGAATA